MNRGTLVWQLTDRGFASEINVMLFAILYCIDNNYHFLLSSKNSSISYEYGWKDYFLPFCNEVDLFALRKAFIWRRNELKFKVILAIQKALLFPFISKPFFLMNEKWDKIWNSSITEKKFLIGKDIEADSYTACQKILFSIWKFNNKTKQIIANIKSKVINDDIPYCSIHIRRGDKINEAPYVSNKKYVEKVLEVNSNIKKIFLMTDDYMVFEELKKQYPHIVFFTLCTKSHKGHLQDKFNKISKEGRKEEILALLAEIEIARNGEFFVGTYTSNICRLMSLLRGRDTTHGVDIPFCMFY